MSELSPAERIKKLEDELAEHRVSLRRAIKAAMVVVALSVFGFAITGWQVDEAFNTVEEERLSRIGGQSSINAYFCRKIDEVGDGVAALVSVSLTNAPPRSELTVDEREGLDRFQAYLEQQERPPRCRAIALQLAVLTGADPADVVITPLRLRPKDAEHSSP